MSVKKFQKIILDHYRQHGRKLPWRSKRTTPYQVVVSEIMLQQTQVERVKVKYREFITRFPNFHVLATARTSAVLAAWQGLGYNRRALALQRLAQVVISKHNGKLPHTVEELDALPGIGEATAGSIVAFAFDQPVVFIETNIRSVFIYFFFPKNKSVRDSELLPLVAAALDRSNPRRWYSALMDYGTVLKKQQSNPGRRSRQYAKQSRFVGSNRQRRGQVLKFLLAAGKGTSVQLAHQLNLDRRGVEKNLTELVREGFLKQRGKYYSIV